MKKILFASAFALIGTFAMANETKNSEVKEEYKSEKAEALEIICIPIELSCTEDCFNVDAGINYTPIQILMELAAQEAYVCGGG
ncbi:hypothetical protein OBK22_13340 [Empedobacter falsenii]